MTKKKTTKKKTDKLGRPHNGGPPTKGIDLAELEILCFAHCTDVEIAAWFGVSQKTIQRRSKLGKFAEVVERGKAKGRASLRRRQMALAEEGNVTMLIWLGKQLLGQRDQLEHTGKDGGVIELSVAEIIRSRRQARLAEEAAQASAITVAPVAQIEAPAAVEEQQQEWLDDEPQETVTD